MKKTEKVGVVVIKDSNDVLKAIIYKDMYSRKNVFYSCTEMSMDELELLFHEDEKNIDSVN